MLMVKIFLVVYFAPSARLELVHFNPAHLDKHALKHSEVISTALGRLLKNY